MNDLTEQFRARLAPYRDRPRWLVAYSGGLDSRVLLQLLWEWREERGDDLPPLTAVHIDHRLQPPSADWAEHCRRTCAALEIPFEQRAATVRGGSGRSLEAEARRERYRLLRDLLATEELLLLAHHRNDQAETVLLRLLRGSGVRGVAGMPRQRTLGAGSLLRPLLDNGRAALRHFAEARGLDWLEDPSNRDERFDRNYLRQRVLPLLAERWPSHAESLARSAEHAAADSVLLDVVARDDLQGLSDGRVGLPVSALLAMESARRNNLLRFWLRQQADLHPEAVQLRTLVDNVLAAAEDADPLLRLGGWELRRFRDRLLLQRPLPPLEAPAELSWSLREPLPVPGMGRLRARRSSAGGALRAGETVRVAFRRGGERCRPAGKPHSRPLKKCLQESGLPPWWRDRVPLIHIDGKLAAVADLWVCEGFQTSPGEEGWVLEWR